MSHRTGLGVVFLVSTVLHGGLAIAEDAPAAGARTALADGVRAMLAGRLDEAEVTLRAAVNGGDPASALGALGTTLHMRGRSDEAEKVLRQAVAKSAGRSPQAAQTRLALAGVLVDARRFSEAERLARQALDMLEETGTVVERITALNVLAETAIAHGDWDAAERRLRDAYRLTDHAEAVPGLRAAVVTRRGLLYLAQGRYHEAEPVLELALELGEDNYGAEHAGLLPLTYALATCYRLRNRPSDAALLYERVLALGERTYGPDHAMLAQAVSGLEIVARRIDDPALAASCRARLASFTPATHR